MQRLNKIRKAVIPVLPKDNKYLTKQKWKSIYDAITGYAVYFCKNSSLHGMSYVGDRNLPILERLFWAVASGTGIAIAIISALNFYSGFQDNPILITFSTETVSVDTIPFPTITICNEKQMYRKNVENYTYFQSTRYRRSLQDKGILTLIEWYCNHISNSVDHNIPVDDDVTQFAAKYQQTMYRMVRMLKWKNVVQRNVTKLLDHTFPAGRVCTSFNYYNTIRHKVVKGHKDIWNSESGYAEASEQTKPIRTDGGGLDKGVVFALDSEYQQLICPVSKVNGFSVSISNPLDGAEEGNYFISPGQETWVTIEPTIKDATPELSSTTVSQRQCYFQNEKYLRYFIHYSYRNCKVECQINRTMDICGCIPFKYHFAVDLNTRRNKRNKGKTTTPKPNNTNNNQTKNETTLCFESYPCLQLNKDYIGRKTSVSDCGCLPPCFEVTYSIKAVSVGKFYKNLEWETLAKSQHSKYKNESLSRSEFHQLLSNIAIVHISFSQNKYEKVTNSVIYGFTELLSNIGSLLGLFIGYSFLSTIDLLYFTVVKLIMYYYNRCFPGSHQ